MKKYLLGTSALIGAVAISTGVMAGGASGGHSGHGHHDHSSAIDVTVGGYLDFQAGFVDQDLDTVAPFNRDAKFQTDTEVHIGAEGRAENGLIYGAVIELEADVTADDVNESGLNADKTYLYLESRAGRVELGSNNGAEDVLKVDAATIARATGGIDGDWFEYVSPSGLVIHPDLPVAHLQGTPEDANKITYYSPRFSGVQVGVSYTPDTGNVGTSAGFTGETTAGNFENVFGVALNYAGTWDHVAIEAAITGAFGDSEVATIEDLAAWNAGLVLSYEGFSLAGSYGDWGDSGFAVALTGADDADYWTLGGAYAHGPWGVSITYLDSETLGADFTNISVGADYQLAPGLVPYVEVSFFDTDPITVGAASNDGTVFLIGTELTF